MSFHAKIWYCFIALGSISGTYGMEDCKKALVSKEALVIQLFTKLEEIQFKAIKKSKRKAKDVKTSMRDRRTLRYVLQKAHVTADVIPSHIKGKVREKVENFFRTSRCDKCMGIKLIKKDKNQKEISYSVYPLLAHLHEYANNEIEEGKPGEKALNYGVTLEYLEALDSAVIRAIKEKKGNLSRSQKKAFKKTCEELLGPYGIRRKKNKRAPLIVIQPVENKKEGEASLEQVIEIPLKEATSPSLTQKGSSFPKAPLLLGIVVPVGFLGKRIMRNKKKRKALPSHKKSNEDPIIK